MPSLLSLLALVGALFSNTLAAPSVAGLSLGPAFQSPVPLGSHSAAAGCVGGVINVTISAPTSRLNISPNINQQNATEVIQELLQTNSPAAKYVGGTATVSGTYLVGATICGPPGATTTPNTIQVLTHGFGLTRAYWDIAPGNSWVDALASSGYYTLAYDWLGTGTSQRVDPVNEAQFPTHIEVLHALSAQLRAGEILSHRFTKIVGVGHSLGSVVQMAAAAKYPGDWDALVLTGVADSLDYIPQTALSLTPLRAADDPSGKWRGLPGAYLVDGSAIGVQQAFYRYPYYNQSVFDAVYAQKGTFTLGEFLTLPALGAGYAAQPGFNKPVAIMTGAQDYTFCLGDCTALSNRAQTLLKNVYPGAAPGSLAYLVPQTGHFVNAHDSAASVFERVVQFLRATGF